MDTPHRGSSPAQLAGLVARIARIAFRQHPNERLIDALRQDSDLLERNRRSFANISDNLPIGSFFEGKGFMTVGLVGGLMCIKRCELIRVVDRGTILCITGHVQRNWSDYTRKPYGYVQICIEGGYGIYEGCLSDWGGLFSSNWSSASRYGKSVSGGDCPSSDDTYTASSC